MTLLRCSKFLRGFTADAPNFDRSHWLLSLLLPPAALDSLSTSARPDLHRPFAKNCHCEPVTAATGVAIRNTPSTTPSVCG